MRLTVVMLACLLAGGATAQPVDPQPDGIGIFFDEGATLWCHDATAGTQVTGAAPGTVELRACRVRVRAASR